MSVVDVSAPRANDSLAGEAVDLEGAGVDVAQHEVAGVSRAMLHLDLVKSAPRRALHVCAFATFSHPLIDFFNQPSRRSRRPQ